VDEAGSNKVEGGKRVLYVLVLLALIVPRIWVFSLPMPIEPETKAVYDIINNLPPGSLVLLDIGTDESGWPYVGDGLVAIVSHLSSRNVKFVISETGSQSGAMIAQMVFDRVPKELLDQREYGVDYLRLPYLPGEEAAVSTLATRFKESATLDFSGRPLNGFPLWQSISSSKDFDLVINAVYMEQHRYFLRHWREPIQMPLVFVVPTALVPYIKPFTAAGQVAGMVAGIRGSAEYESLIGRPRGAAREMTTLTLAVLVMLGSMVVGNIEQWRGKAKQRQV
jgi:hypothetical protein